MPIKDRGRLLQARTVVSNKFYCTEAYPRECCFSPDNLLAKLSAQLFSHTVDFLPTARFEKFTHKHINIQDQQPINCAL